MASVGTLKADVVVNSEGAVAGMRKAEQAVSGGASRIRSKLNEMASTKSIVEEQIAKGGWNAARFRPGAIGGGGGGAAGGGLRPEMIERLQSMGGFLGMQGAAGQAGQLAKLGMTFGLGGLAGGGALAAVGMLHSGINSSGEEARKQIDQARQLGLSVNEFAKAAEFAGGNSDMLKEVAESLRRLASEGPNAAAGLKQLGDQVGSMSGGKTGDDMMVAANRMDVMNERLSGFKVGVVDKLGNAVDWLGEWWNGEEHGSARATRIQQEKWKNGQAWLSEQRAAGNATAKDIMRPEEKLREKLGALQDQLLAGAITEDQWRRAADKARKDSGMESTGFSGLAEVGSQEAYAATIAAQYGDEGVGHLRSIEQHLANIDARGQGLGLIGDGGKAVDF